MREDVPKYSLEALPSPEELFQNKEPVIFVPDIPYHRKPIPQYRLEGRRKYLFLLIPLAIIFLLAFLPRLGYGYYCMTSTSMQSAIPRGSFLFVRQVQPEKLRVHDVITFVTDHGQCVTHEIVRILPHSQDQGGNKYITKGTDNVSADSTPVTEGQIVGKVLFHIPKLGALLYGIKWIR